MNNLFFGTVVLLEDNESSIWIVIMKIADIFGVGSLELVDGLIIITNGEDIRILRIDREDSIDESHLCFIGILEFIDHDELVGFRETHADNVILFDEADSLEDHIREIDQSFFLESILIEFENISESELFLELACFLEFTDIFVVFLSPSIAPSIHELCTIISFI